MAITTMRRCACATAWQCVQPHQPAQERVMQTQKIMIGVVLAAAAAVGVVWASSAKAQTPSVYVGVHGGQTAASTELSATLAQNFGVSLDGLSSNGMIGGIHAGMDLQLANSVVFFGVLGGYDWQNTEFSITAGQQSFTANLGDSWYVGGRAGVVVHGAKVYGLAAWRQTEWSSSVKNLTIDDPRGWDVGIGIDVPISKGVVLGVEGIRTQYQKGEFATGANATPSGVYGQTDQISVMARLSFALGGNPASIFDDAAPAPKTAKACDPKTGCK
jgi:opacity protein-like surface antigen